MSPLLPAATGAPHHGTPHPEHKDKLMATSVFLSLLLTIFVIALGERAAYDVNRLFNPSYGSCNPPRYLVISDRVCQVLDNGLQNLLFHSYVTVPIFLIALGLMVYFKHRRAGVLWHEALYRVAGMVMLVFGLQILLEVTFYLFQYHPLVAWYFTFIAGITVASALVVYIERRQAEKRALKRGLGDYRGEHHDDIH